MTVASGQLRADLRAGESAADGRRALRPAAFQLGRATNNWTQPAVGCPTNHPCVTVTNIVGFFVHRPWPAEPTPPMATFSDIPVVTIPTAPTFVDDGSWLVTTHLIR